MNWKSKFWVSALLIRRLIFVIMLITLESIQSWILICALSILQIWYLAYVIILRPFINKKDNIIEITNEIFFSVLLISLIFFNLEKDWNSTIIEVYIWIITSNTLVTFFIIIGKSSHIIIIVDLIKSFVLLVKNRWLKPSQGGMLIKKIFVCINIVINIITTEREIKIKRIKIG